MNSAWEDHFYGRQKELNFLLDTYAALLDKGIESSGSEIVVIKGDSGWGKTALVHEFYKKLVEKYGGNYWPDKIGTENKSLAVNPSFHNHEINKDCKMPFLWWGIRSPNLSKRNVDQSFVLESYLPYLLPHLQSIKRAQQRKKLLVKGLKIALNIATLGVSENLSDAKTLFDAGVDGISMRGVPKKQNVFESIMAERLTLRKKIIALFKELFKQETYKVKIPVIIFLDDAQFSDIDETLITTLSDLLKLAEEERYPVLLIINHWESHWNEQLSNSFKTSRGNEGISKLLYTFINMKEGFEPSSDDLNKSHRLILLGHLPEISSILNSVAPNLPHEQQQQILRKTGGNPLLLEQVYRRYLTSSHNYKDENFKSGLKDSVITSIINKTFELHMLIEDRLLEDRLKDIKVILSYASQQGSMFSVNILKITTRQLGGYDVDKIIEVAAITERLIEKNPQQLYEFIQPAVYEVANKFARELEIVESYLPALQQWCVEITFSDLKSPDNISPIWHYNLILESVIRQKLSISERDSCSLIIIYGIRCWVHFHLGSKSQCSYASERILEYINLLPIEWLKRIRPEIILAASSIRGYMGDIKGAQKLNNYILTNEAIYGDITRLFGQILVYDESILEGITIAQINNNKKTAKELSYKLLERLKIRGKDCDKNFYCYALLKTGKVFMWCNEFQDATTHFEQAVKLSVNITANKNVEVILPQVAMQSLIELAKSYSKQDKVKSIEYFEYALTIKSQVLKYGKYVPVDAFLVKIFYNKALLTAQMGDSAVALELIDLAINQAIDDNKNNTSDSSLQTIATCYEFESKIFCLLNRPDDLKNSCNKYFLAVKQLSERTKSIIGFSMLNEFIHTQFNGPLREDIGNLWRPAFQLASEMLRNTEKKDFEINMIFNLFEESIWNCHKMILLKIIAPFPEFYLFNEECYRLIRTQSDTDPLNQFLLMLIDVTTNSSEIDEAVLLDRLNYGIKYATSYLNISRSAIVARSRYAYYHRLSIHYKEKKDADMAVAYAQKTFEEMKYIIEEYPSLYYLGDLCDASANYCGILSANNNEALSCDVLEQVEKIVLKFESDHSCVDEYHAALIWKGIGALWNTFYVHFPRSSIITSNYWVRLVNLLRLIENKCNSGIGEAHILFTALVDLSMLYKKENQKESALATIKILKNELENRSNKLHPLTLRYFGNISSQIRGELIEQD